MQITLNIKDETEFLNEIKEIVRAQVKQIARDDVKAIYQNEITEVVRKFTTDYKKTLQESFDNKASKELKTVINWAIDNHGEFWRNSDFVKNKATEILKDILPDVISKKVKIEDILAEAKKDFLKKLLDK